MGSTPNARGGPRPAPCLAQFLRKALELHEFEQALFMGKFEVLAD
jgi:hypothetical protein